MQSENQLLGLVTQNSSVILERAILVVWWGQELNWVSSKRVYRESQCR